MKMTMYDIMKAHKTIGAWRFCSAIFPKFETLILYYRVYEIFQKKITSRKRGYLVELLNDASIQAILPKDKFQCIKWGTDDLRWAIREMEREYYI